MWSEIQRERETLIDEFNLPCIKKISWANSHLYLSSPSNIMVIATGKSPDTARRVGDRSMIIPHCNHLNLKWMA